MSELSQGRWLKMNNAKAVEAKSLYESGLSVADVAKQMGVTRQSMHKTLQRLGTKFRSKLRYGEKNHFYRGGQKANDTAQNKAEKAIVTGRLVRPKICQNCGTAPPLFKDGRSAIQAHHDDYNKPLQVRWLCQPCHYEAHKESV